MKVLFVCTANICRSAYAETMARHLLPGGFRYSSAGVHGFVDEPMDPLMAEQAWARGASTTDFRSRRLTMDMVDDAELVLTAEARHRRFILEEHPVAVRKTFALGQFARGLTAVEDPSDRLFEQVRAQAATSTAADDVVDPYGRGPLAARTSAEAVDRLLRLILPALAGAPSAAG